MRLMILSLAVSCLIPFVAEAQQAPSTDGKGYWEVTLSSTLLNSYSRGNLDDWWAEQTGDPDRKVDQGSPAFFALEGRQILPMPSGKSWLTMGGGIIFPADHALWGSSIFFGGFRRLVMQPTIISFNMTSVFNVESMDGLTAEFGGGMLIGWVTGEYVGTNFDYDVTLGPGLGFALTGGANYMINDQFGLSVKSGLRFLKTDLVIRDPDSPTGYSQFRLDNDDEVKPSLSGFYLTIGVTLRPAAIMGARK